MSTRLSMGSDGEGGGRRSTNLYRTGGAVMGGAEPLFDYPGDREHHVQMERFEEGEEDEDEGRWQSDEERRAMLKGGEAGVRVASPTR